MKPQRSEHESFDTLFEVHDVEVDEQADVLSREFEIRQHLGSVHRGHSPTLFECAAHALLFQLVRATHLDLGRNNLGATRCFFAVLHTF